eukprot:Hpha_TRINITY_DN16763_c4_g1::TRINITY_DN16763_c4_g1_i5::g.79590::m.79590
MKRCCGFALVRKGDSKEESSIKEVLFPVALVQLSIAIFTSFSFLRDSQLTGALGVGFILFGQLVFLVGVLLDLAPARYLVDALLIISGVGVVFVDLYNASLSGRFRAWGFIVLILDASLTFDRNHIPLFIIPCTLIYLAFESVESVHRFGLYDFGAWGTSEGDSQCMCATPPCEDAPMSAALTLLCVCLVFLVDYYLTSRFAAGMRFQLRCVESSVAVAEEVASALAEYDVDAADLAIAEGKDLPPRLKASYKQLLANLRSYRAYLPHSCLVQRGSDAGSSSDGSEGKPTAVEKGNRGVSIASPTTTTGFSLDSQSVYESPRGEIMESPVHRRTQFSFSSARSRRKTSAASSAASEVAERVQNLKMGKKRRKVSLAAGNMIGYLTFSGDLLGAAHDMWISADVERWCSTVESLRGVVDVMAGDRRYASFNARQRCGGHASAAVGVLSSRGEGEWSGCVVTGQAVCGDFGSASVLRFMVLGGLSSSLHPLERTAAQWRTKVLVDDEAYLSACFNWNGVLLGAVFMAKRGDKPLRVYSMTSARKRAKDQGHEEWMYELANMGTGEYEEVNNAKEVLIKTKLETIHPELVVEEAQGEAVMWTLRDVGLYQR